MLWRELQVGKRYRLIDGRYCVLRVKGRKWLMVEWPEGGVERIHWHRVMASA